MPINTISKMESRVKFDLGELEGIERPLHTPYGYKITMTFLVSEHAPIDLLEAFCQWIRASTYNAMVERPTCLDRKTDW